MRLSFEQFRKEPQKALMYAMIFAMTALYIRAERQSYVATAQCEKRLVRCEMQLAKMSAMLKTQDSLCSALVTEIKIYKELGKI
jgi:hypothetical protein